MLQFLYTYPEWLLMPTYAVVLGMALVKGEWGKVLYWIGVIILTIGILKMKG